MLMSETKDRDIIRMFASPGRIVNPPKRDNLPSELSNSKYWGVKSLPWLILTDNKHSVVAEGFSLTELENQLEQLGDKL